MSDFDGRLGPGENAYPTAEEIQRVADRIIESVKEQEKMANSTYEVLEIKFKFLPDWTECTVICGPTSDGMLGVQGAHTKVFPKDRDALSILQKEIASAEFLVGEDWR